MASRSAHLAAGHTPECYDGGPCHKVDPIGEREAFTAAVSKALLSLKAGAGIQSIRQNYKGTGSQRARRQLWIRGGSWVTDVWLDPEGYTIGGVCPTKAPGGRYGTMGPAEVAAQIAERLKALR